MIDTKYTNHDLALKLGDILLGAEKECKTFEESIQALKSKIGEDQLRELILFINNLGDDVSPSSMRERLSTSEMMSFKKSLRSYISILSRYPNSEKYVSFYKSLLSRVNVSRLEATKIAMLFLLDEGLLKTVEDTADFLDRIDKDSKEKISNELSKYADKKKAYEDKPPSDDFDKVVKRNRDIFFIGLDKFIQQMAIRKTPSKQAQAEIDKNLSRVFNNINAYLRTELNNRFNQNILNAMKEHGIEEYEYCAILDERTSEICRELDGMVFLVSEAVVGVNRPPMHMRCRSYIVPKVKPRDS